MCPALPRSRKRLTPEPDTPPSPSPPPPPPPPAPEPEPEPPQEPQPLVVVPLQQIPSEDLFDILSPLDETPSKKEPFSAISDELRDRAFNSLLNNYQKGEGDDVVSMPLTPEEPISSFPNLEDEVRSNIEMFSSLTTGGVARKLNYEDLYAPPWDPKPTSPSATLVGAGIANLGNTCFIGSILQCFTHTALLVQGLLASIHNTHCSVKGFCIICAFREHIDTSLASSGSVVWPHKFVEHMSYFSPSFVQDVQQDAHEFMQSALNKLKSCLPEGEDNLVEKVFDENIVEKVFGGRVITKLRCLNCGHSSNKSEPLIDLSLGIENVYTLQHALESYTNVEKIDEKLKCDGCGEDVSMEKQDILDQTPSVAALHLKRFKRAGNSVQKISSPFHFTLDLDLQPYTTDNSNDNALLKYDLYAIVVHVGDSPNEGHYYCMVRSAPDKWHKFNDSQVSSVSIDTVMSEEPYILFYARQGTPWFFSIMEDVKSASENKGDEQKKYDPMACGGNDVVMTPRTPSSWGVSSPEDEYDVDCNYPSPSEYYFSPQYAAKLTSPSAKLVGAGVANLGSTCFMGSILQCFTHTVLLVQGLRSTTHSTPCGADGFCFICALREHIDSSLASSGSVVKPTKLVDNLSYFSPSFKRRKQEDAHEFMLLALNKLKSCLPDGEDNLVDKIFGGRLITKLRCLNCGHSSHTYEPLLDLSLGIENVYSLQHALESYTNVEKIDGKCDGCGEDVSMEKQDMLDKTPSVAVFHLKRAGTSVQKITSDFHFTWDLDLQPYTSDNGNDNVLLKYDLYAIVVHIGSSPNAGHYYCLVRSAPGRWHKLNDSEVGSISSDIVMYEEAYILFYARQGTPWFSSIMDGEKSDPKSVLEDKADCGDDKKGNDPMGASNEYVPDRGEECATTHAQVPP